MERNKIERRQRIRHRIAKKIEGTAKSPRLSVYRSNKDIYVQIIDDINSKTLAAASSHEKKFTKKKDTKIEVAKKVGKLIGQRAVEAGIKEVIFDRGGYLYHGRVKALADAAREEGLKF
jgi:large subunit ribosomal protein L18